MKIKITAKARELLAEQAANFEKLNRLNEILADRETSDSAAMHAGADKLAVEACVLGCAWRLHQEVTGTKPI